MAANSVVGDGILTKFKLIQAFMVVLVTCKNGEGSPKNEGIISPIISLLGFFQTLKGSYLDSPGSDLAEF